VQLDLRDGDVTAVQALLARAGLPIVIDHMGRLAPDAPRDGVLRLLDTARCWLKLSAPYRLSRQPPPHQELLPLIRELVHHRADRLLWATDWPHTEQIHTMPRATELSTLCHLWLPTAALRQQVCVENPRVLYQF
jgi:predicted TIM-barrel fold metal-dependent hydrolase